MKNSNNNIAIMPQAAAAPQATPIFTTANRDQLRRYNEITGDFFGFYSSSSIISELLELYGYMEESGLIQGVDDKATSEIKRDYLFTIQKLSAFVADVERNHLFFKGK